MALFATSRDRTLAVMLIGMAVIALSAIRPIVAHYNDTHLLKHALASGNLRTFLIQGMQGPVLIQTASTNGHTVNRPWTAIIYRSEAGDWMKIEPFNYNRTYWLATEGVSNYPDIAALARTPPNQRHAELVKLGFTPVPPSW